MAFENVTCSVRMCKYSITCFFFNDTATTEIYTLSLHDALPISPPRPSPRPARRARRPGPWRRDRKSTRLNSSHTVTSYAVFCLKKKKHNKRKIEHRHTKKTQSKEPKKRTKT